MASVGFQGWFSICFVVHLFEYRGVVWHFAFTYFSYIVSGRCFGLRVFFFQDNKDCFSFNDFV